MFGDGFSSKSNLPKPMSPSHGPPRVKNQQPKLNLEKKLNPMRKVDQGKKIGHYHGLHIMSHFPKV